MRDTHEAENKSRESTIFMDLPSMRRRQAPRIVVHASTNCLALVATSAAVIPGT
jgi:hypothetical protein